VNGVEDEEGNGHDL